VPEADRIALLENLPEEAREAGYGGFGLVVMEESRAAAGAAMLKQAAQSGVPDDAMIESALCLVAPEQRARALAGLPGSGTKRPPRTSPRAWPPRRTRSRSTRR
jgi:hypothetical protein